MTEAKCRSKNKWGLTKEGSRRSQGTQQVQEQHTPHDTHNARNVALTQSSLNSRNRTPPTDHSTQHCTRPKVGLGGHSHHTKVCKSTGASCSYMLRQWEKSQFKSVRASAHWLQEASAQRLSPALPGPRRLWVFAKTFSAFASLRSGAAAG